MDHNLPQRSWLSWSIFVFSVAFMLIAPFYKGLFNAYQASFEGAIYGAAAWAAAASLLLAVAFYRFWKPGNPADWLVIAIWLIPLTCVLSIWGAASSHLAMNEIYIKVVWAIFFLIGVFLASQQFYSKLLVYSILGTGSILVIYGLLNFFGQASYKDAVLDPARLSNVFQYPNTYAAFLIALLIGLLILMSSAKNLRSFVFPALMLVPVFLSILLTVSRGALVLMPVILVFYFLCLPWYRQLLSTFYLIVTGVLAFILFSPVVGVYNSQKETYSILIAAKGWFMVVTASLVAATIMYFVFRYSTQYINRRFPMQKLLGWRNAIVPCIVVATAVIGYIVLISTPTLVDKLPQEIKSRIQNNGAESPSVYSRNAFFKDAWDISKEFPLLGGGGGAWSELYNSYKSYPYTSAQAHNFYLQYLVESGWIGIITLFLFIFFVYAIFLNSLKMKYEAEYEYYKLVFPVFPIAILVHSSIDFNMSYVYLSALVFLTLGASVSVKGHSVTVQKIISKMPKFSTIYAIMLAIIAVIVCFNTVQAWQAYSSYKAARTVLAETGDYMTYKKHIDKALSLQPNHPEYSALEIQVLLDVYKQTQQITFLDAATQRLIQAQQFAANNKALGELAYKMEIEKEDYLAAIGIVVAKIEQYPWDIVWYERAIELYFVEGFNNLDKREQYWADAFFVLEKIQGKQQFVNGLPRGLQKDPFKVTNLAALNIGKIMYYKQDFERSGEFLKGNLVDDMKQEVNRELVRWYLASLNKQGKTDDWWKNKLIESDPNEEELIQSVINSV